MRVMCSCIYCRSIVLSCSSLWVLLLSLLGVSMGGHCYIVLHLCFIVLHCATLGRMGGQDKESRSGKQVSRPAGALTKIQIESPKGEREAQREVLSVTKLKPTRAHRGGVEHKHTGAHRAQRRVQHNPQIWQTMGFGRSFLLLQPNLERRQCEQIGKDQTLVSHVALRVHSTDKESKCSLDYWTYALMFLNKPLNMFSLHKDLDSWMPVQDYFVALQKLKQSKTMILNRRLASWRSGL